MGYAIGRYICPYTHVIIKEMPKGTLLLVYCIKDKNYWGLVTGKMCKDCKEKILLNEKRKG